MHPITLQCIRSSARMGNCPMKVLSLGRVAGAGVENIALRPTVVKITRRWARGFLVPRSNGLKCWAQSKQQFHFWRYNHEASCVASVGSNTVDSC